MWVFILVGVYVILSLIVFTDVLTLPSWSSGESFNLHSCNIIRAGEAL